MTNETWFPIFGYEKLYEVSTLGRVKRLPSGLYSDGHILKLKPAKGGYLQVGLCKNSKVYNAKVHRLVALTFLLNLDGTKQVNHIDGDKENNNVDNLEWVTPLENTTHAIKIGLRKSKPKPPVKLSNKQINEIRLILQSKELNYREIAETYNVSKTLIWQIANNKQRMGMI
jgi:hypothetical protein